VFKRLCVSQIIIKTMSQYFNCPHLNCLTCNCTQNQKNIVFTALKMPCTNDSATMSHLLSPYLAKKPLWKFSYHHCLDQETIKKLSVIFSYFCLECTCVSSKQCKLCFGLCSSDPPLVYINEKDSIPLDRMLSFCEFIYLDNVL